MTAKACIPFGLVVALPQALWINWPPAVHVAEHKPWQLVEAAVAGLRVLRTRSSLTISTQRPASPQMRLQCCKGIPG